MLSCDSRETSLAILDLGIIILILTEWLSSSVLTLLVLWVLVCSKGIVIF